MDTLLGTTGMLTIIILALYWIPRLWNRWEHRRWWDKNDQWWKEGGDKMDLQT
jgi:hypothetical protein